MWSFIIPNERSNNSLEDFRVPTSQVEQFSGLFIWEGLVGLKMESELTASHSVLGVVMQKLMLLYQIKSLAQIFVQRVVPTI